MIFIISDGKSHGWRVETEWSREEQALPLLFLGMKISNFFFKFFNETNLGVHHDALDLPTQQRDLHQRKCRISCYSIRWYQKVEKCLSFQLSKFLFVTDSSIFTQFPFSAIQWLKCTLSLQKCSRRSRRSWIDLHKFWPDFLENSSSESSIWMDGKYFYTFS